MLPKIPPPLKVLNMKRQQTAKMMTVWM